MSVLTIRENKTYAHVIPFAVFMSLLLLDMLVDPLGIRIDNDAQPWYRRHPEYVLMLLQVVVCLPLIVYWRKAFEWNLNHYWWLGLLGGVIGIGLWILPTYLYSALDLKVEGGDPDWYRYFGLADRREGFDGKVFEDSSLWYWVAMVLRFVRAVIVVALVEEIIWRGFLMRFILKPDGNYWEVPFGKAHWKSYLVVTAAFTIAHNPVDWLGCVCFGSIMYFVAVKSKSLFACILMHGVANLLMGWYALTFGKYGLW